DRRRGAAVHCTLLGDLLCVRQLHVGARYGRVVVHGERVVVDIQRGRPARRVPDEARAAGGLNGGGLPRGAEGGRVVGGIVGIQPAPGDVARSAQADTIRAITIAERGVVAPDWIVAGVVRHEILAVEEVAVLVDADGEIGADQTVVGRVGVRAGVAEAATPGADAIAIAIADAVDLRRIERTGVHQVETDAIGTVIVAAA